MKYRHLILSVLTVVVLMFASCEKARPTMAYVSGDDKDKIDLKGTLMKPDMRYENIYAELVGKTVYVYFNETVESCLITFFSVCFLVVRDALVKLPLVLSEIIRQQFLYADIPVLIKAHLVYALEALEPFILQLNEMEEIVEICRQLFHYQIDIASGGVRYFHCGFKRKVIRVSGMKGQLHTLRAFAGYAKRRIKRNAVAGFSHYEIIGIAS